MLFRIKLLFTVGIMTTSLVPAIASPDYTANRQNTYVVDYHQDSTSGHVNLLVRSTNPLTHFQDDKHGISSKFDSDDLKTDIMNSIKAQGISDKVDLTNGYNLIDIDLMSAGDNPADGSDKPMYISQEATQFGVKFTHYHSATPVINTLDAAHCRHQLCGNEDFTGGTDRFMWWQINPAKHHIMKHTLADALSMLGSALHDTGFGYADNPDLTQKLYDYMQKSSYQTGADFNNNLPTVILIHCMHGKDRTGVAAVSYLMKEAKNNIGSSYPDLITDLYNLGTTVYVSAGGSQRDRYMPQDDRLNLMQWVCLKTFKDTPFAPDCINAQIYSEKIDHNNHKNYYDTKGNLYKGAIPAPRDEPSWEYFKSTV